MTTEKHIALHTLKEITNGFSARSRIGRGGYGDVHKGVYHGEVIAVKLLHAYMVRGDDRMFNNEVAKLLMAKHPNIVQLIGYCNEAESKLVEWRGEKVFSERKHRVICYEYLEGGSLDKHLHAQSFARNWSTCYNIMKGICEGLNFLHQCEPQILHLDLKPANILLGSSMEPKVANFGLYHLFAGIHNIGTRKYMPPEFIDNGIISPKNDVFSLGVIMIEIIVGSTGYSDSVEMDDVAKLMREVLTNWTAVIEATSKHPSEELHQVQKCMELAKHCVDSERDNRPRTADILDALNKTEANILKRQPVLDIHEGSSIIGRTEELHNVLPILYDIEGIDKTTLAFNDTRSQGYSQMQRDRAITARSELEHMLFDESAEPKPLPLLLLEHITSGFSDDRKIGSGGFAIVYKGMLEYGQVAVKKLLETAAIDDDKFTEEVRCLMKTKHKNIVRFLGYCADTQGEMVKFEGKHVLAGVQQRLFCFEYLPNGSLENQITDSSCGLKWRKRYKIINGICDGLYYLHQMQIVHLDLKPENILLDDNMMPKIADFGLSRCFDDKQSRAIASKVFGTMGYMAPEFLCGRQITFKSDIYSLGIILIRILTGEKGYPCPDIDNVLESWSNRLGKSEVDAQLLQIRVCTQIAIDCTDWNPENRPDIQDIIARLGATKSVGDSATEIGTSGS